MAALYLFSALNISIRDILFLCQALFAFSIILIAPWGGSRGEIWTQPKVFALLLISLLNLSILWSQRVSLTRPRSWFISKLLWELFLGIGLLSTIFSPFPLRSLFGQEQMGDGWLYWLIIATFTFSNTLLLRHHPELLRSQVNGLVIPIPTYKAHNLILDTTLSVGVLGLLCYGALLVFCFRLVQLSPIGGIEAVAVGYIAFSFTWFECAQFTHIAWWVLSLWGVKEVNLGK